MGEMKSVTAKHGEKMIEVRLRFWTNDISPIKDEILPKQGWTAGKAYMVKNDAHGIAGKANTQFNSLLQIGEAVGKVLVAEGVTLRPNGMDAKLVEKRGK